MVIEANKDSAIECVFRAKEAMKNNDISRMQKLLRKAKQLDPNCDIHSILRTGNGEAPPTGGEAEDNSEASNNSYSHDDHYNSFDEAELLRNRKSKARSDSPGPSHSGRRPHRSPNRNSQAREDPRNKSRSKSASRPTLSGNVEYTAEDSSQVERIRHCKDYYEILQINKTEFCDIVLKKKYRELALKLHPDKCKAPGATEAFKALGNAYAVLSDPKKRDDYDRFGSEEQRSVRRNRHRHSDFYEYDVNRGFEAEMSPEDIFEMFFGGAFPSSSVHRRRAQYHFRQEFQHPREEPSLFYQLLQILPILVILLGGLLIQFFSTEPAYSLNRDNTYNVQRYTRDLRVPYYVKPDFEQIYRNKIPQVEHHVENEYVATLRTQCYREKSNREGLLWTAKMRGDADLWKRAQEMELVYCKRLEELYR